MNLVSEQLVFSLKRYNQVKKIARYSVFALTVMFDHSCISFFNVLNESQAKIGVFLKWSI